MTCPHPIDRRLRLLWTFTEEQRNALLELGALPRYTHQTEWCCRCTQIINQENSIGISELTLAQKLNGHELESPGDGTWVKCKKCKEKFTVHRLYMDKPLKPC